MVRELFFFLQFKGGDSVIFQHCGLAVTVTPLDMPEERQCQAQERYL